MSWTTIGVLWVIGAVLATIFLSRMFRIAESNRVHFEGADLEKLDDFTWHYPSDVSGQSVCSVTKTCPNCRSQIKVVIVGMDQAEI